MIWDSYFKYSAYFKALPWNLNAGSPGGTTNRNANLVIGLNYTECIAVAYFIGGTLIS
jgi:hypothetical protein